jgi:hypothetical protein
MTRWRIAPVGVALLVLGLLLGMAGGIALERLRLLPEERLAQRLTRAEEANAQCERDWEEAVAKTNPVGRTAVAVASKPLTTEELLVLERCGPVEREVKEARTAVELWRHRTR